MGPILLCEFLWSLGENIYTSIYGHIGTGACAAMTLTFLIQTIATGTLAGIGSAAGIIVGESLGSGNADRAYDDSKRFFKITIIMAVIIGVIISFLAPLYVRLFYVESSVRQTTIYILYGYALVFCGK